MSCLDPRVNYEFFFVRKKLILINPGHSHFFHSFIHSLIYCFCFDFSSFHLRTFSSCRTVVSLHPNSTTLIDRAVCFTTMLFTYTCLPFVFRCMYFIHATYMLIFYLFITCHASMAYLYINLSVDLAVSLASL